MWPPPPPPSIASFQSWFSPIFNLARPQRGLKAQGLGALPRWPPVILKWMERTPLTVQASVWVVLNFSIRAASPDTFMPAEESSTLSGAFLVHCSPSASPERLALCNCTRSPPPPSRPARWALQVKSSLWVATDHFKRSAPLRKVLLEKNAHVCAHWLQLNRFGACH